MDIFNLEGDIPIITPQGVFVPELKAIWDKDTSKGKSKASKYFIYIYHMVNMKSVYANIPLKDRHDTLVRDYFNKKTWEPTKEVIKAMEKYKELITTPEQRMLHDAIEMANNLSKHIRELNFNDKNEKGDFINDTNKAIGYLKSLGPAVESLEKLRLKVEKGIDEKNNNRGDVELNMFDQ